MKKAGFLAVSLVSLMTAGVANAAVTSKTYVDDIAATLATKTQLESFATKAALKDVDDGYKAADDAILKKIGTVENNKTVVEMITDAVSDSAYDDTALAGRVKTIEDSAVMASGATKAKIDAIGTNTNSITAIQSEQTSQAAKISALETGKQAVGDYATNTVVNGVKATAEAASAKATANETAITGLQTGKQDKLTTENIKGTGSVSVTVANGVVTVDGTDTKYTLPVAGEALGGVKSGGNITVANDGAVTVNQAAQAVQATKATQDASGNVITETYATKTDLNTKQATLTSANIKGDGSVSVTVADGVVTVSGTDTQYTLPVAGEALGGVKSGGNITVANDGAVTVNQAAQAAEATKATQDASGNVITETYATKTDLTGVQTTANTAVTDAETAQARADSAYALAETKIPKPSGDCKDCVLHYNGTAFSWEEIGR